MYLQSNPDLVDIYVEQVQQKPFEAVVLVDIWQKEQKTVSHETLHNGYGYSCTLPPVIFALVRM